MALLNCSECSGKVSDKASSCPHCGAPIHTAAADGKQPLSKAIASGDPHSVPVPPMGLVSNASTATSPLSDATAMGSLSQSIVPRPAAPAANHPDQNASVVGRNIVVFLVVLFIFVGTSFIPDHYEINGRSLPWQARFISRFFAIALTYGLFFFNSKKRENPVGIFLVLAALIAAFFLRY